MGKEKMVEEEIVDALDDVLGLSEDENSDNISDEGSSTKDVQEQKEEEKEEVETNEDSTPPKNDNITLTPQQVEISSEIAKLDVKIEELQKHEVNEDKFYETLDDELSEEEAQLEFDDKVAYRKLIISKRDEYLAKNSKADELKALKDKKEELNTMNEIQAGITEVSSKYPEYDHEKMISFFENDLTKTQQREIMDEAQSYSDVYEATYKTYAKLNPTHIKKDETKEIPNVNNARKESVNNTEVTDGLKSEDEELQEALGL